ncbi:MAG: 4Fe-4S binding protein, partial [Deltaproteobacteria bacterium]|nr:4Fe-4S binding protein [Deltaproteobacteria bacterium]
RYGVYTTLFVFCCILAFDTGYGLHGNVKNTLLLLSCLLSLCALLSLVFNHRTYCSYVCPVGVFSRVYGRISLLQQRPPKSICTSCGSMTHPQSQNEDWLFELECLAKCKRRSDLLFFDNPLTLISKIEKIDFCEAVAPICLVVLFFFHVFFSSGYFVSLHDQTTTILHLNMDLFAFSLALTVSTILVVTLVARISLHLAKRIGHIKNLPAYRGWYSIAVLLVVFHLLLLSYDIEAVPTLPSPGQYVVLGAGFLGTLVTLVALFPRDTFQSWTRSLVVFATIGIPVVVAFLIALITIKYVAVLGC